MTTTPMSASQPKHQPGIAVEQRGRVLVARIDGGPRGEFDRELAAELMDLVGRAESDDGVGAVILTGTHPGRFIAHASIPWLQEAGAASPAVGPRVTSPVIHTAGAVRRIAGIRRLAERTPISGAIELVNFHETLVRMNRCGAVFIAALNGSALGVGSEIALACDYRVMAAGDYVIGQPEALLGFPPGGGGTQRLARLVGPHAALKLMLSGEGLDPEAAAKLGCVDEVVAADELLDRTVALGERLAKRIKPTVAAVKRSAYIGASQTLEDGLHLERAEFLAMLAHPDAQAAMLAYIDQTAAMGDLPLHDRPTYEQTVEDGRFRRQ